MARALSEGSKITTLFVHKFFLFMPTFRPIVLSMRIILALVGVLAAIGVVGTLL
jgi:hypothetical protein